jgi:Protein of unknown function (DUF1552)
MSGFDRRRFLRGLGACVALPAFETFLPSVIRAAETETGAALASSTSGSPVRMAFVYFPNGAIPSTWWPKAEGTEFEFNNTMKPLENLKNRVQVLGGLDHINATPGPDGAGDHARANGTFLTGVRVRKTAGADIHADISIDQVAAEQIGHLTRFPSLELSCEPARRTGNCDSGYSCAYQYNLAWHSPTAPVAPEANPRLVFERLFGAGAQGHRKEGFFIRQQQQQSVLDFVQDDARALAKKLGGRDQQKLDDYLTSIREIEKRIQKAEESGAPPDPAIDTPAGIPASYQEHIQIMFDMLLLAFQTDSTRIATMLLAHDGSNRTFPDLGFPEGHHNLTHHHNDKSMIEKVAQIDQFYMQRFADFLQKLEDTKDLDGHSLLYNSMIVYGCGNADGNAHSHVNLPLVFAGAGGGTLTPGRYVKHKSEPACNLFLSMIDRMGVKGVERFGDSTGRLANV